MQLSLLLLLLPQSAGPLLVQPTSAAQRQPAGPPSGIVAAALLDLAGGSAIEASSAPALGRLYPLSSELFVEAGSGHVGIGTTTPAVELELIGSVSLGNSHVNSGLLSSVLGGANHDVRAGHAGVGSGQFNSIDADGANSFIGGGFANAISHSTFFPAFGSQSAIGGGDSNLIHDASLGFVGGGANNRIDGPGAVSYAALVGGKSNRIEADYGAIGGGSANDVTGVAGTVPGGDSNEAAGLTSFAAGRLAEALHDGTFVWADRTGGAFASTGADQFLVRAGGGVGINEASPQTALHVQAASLGYAPNVGAGIDGIAVEAQDAALTLASSDSGSAGSALSLQDWAGGLLQDNWSLYRRTSSTSSALQVTYGASPNWAVNPAVMTFTAGGNVGIGTGSPGAKLEVAGDVWAANFQQVSDARLKTDVRTLDGTLEAVRALRGVRFRWDRAARPEADEREHVGFLAQEVRAVVPEVVSEGPDGTLTVSYAELVPVLLGALQEQDRRIAALEARLAGD